MKVTRSARRMQDWRWHLFAISVVVLPLFLLNARWGVEGNVDTIAATLPAYQLVQEGSLDLSGYEPLVENLGDLDRWFVPTDSGEVVSNRAPGLIALATPSYALIRRDTFTIGPGTVVALIATFLAVVTTWAVLRELIGLNRATVAAITLAIGTTTWWVSSSELWPHGPGQLWAALAVLSVSKGSYSGAGASFALSVVTRPLTGLFAFFSGLLESWRSRSLRPALLIGSVSAAGVVALVLYNRFVFGAWSLRGGYSSDFTSGAIARFNLWDYGVNVWRMFIGLPNGVLTTTPIIGVAVIGAIVARRHIPGWAKSLAVAGLGYLLVHALLNRASGGAEVFYRYPLESIVLAAPFLAIGASRLWDEGGWRRSAVRITVILSIALQFLNVFVLSCDTTDPVVRTCLF